MTQLDDPTRHDSLTLLMLYSKLIREGEILRQRREFGMMHLRESGVKKSQTKKSQTKKSQTKKSDTKKSDTKKSDTKKSDTKNVKSSLQKKREEKRDLIQLPSDVTSDVKMLISSSRDALEAVRSAARLVRRCVSKRDGVRAASSVWPMFKCKTTWPKFQFHFMKGWKSR